MCCLLLRKLIAKQQQQQQQHRFVTRGFLTRRWDTTKLLEFCGDLSQESLHISSEKPADIVYIDCAKAVDSVVHAKLIVKLQS